MTTSRIRELRPAAKLRSPFTTASISATSWQRKTCMPHKMLSEVNPCRASSRCARSLGLHAGSRPHKDVIRASAICRVRCAENEPSVSI
eukprot:scaffold100981_cov31-Tisochrysis_lutea.AAC.2